MNNFYLKATCSHRYCNYICAIILFNFISYATVYSLQPQSVYSNGVFVIPQARSLNSQNTISENGIFESEYTTGKATPLKRVLENFNLYENGTLLFSLKNIPGSSVLLSNAGYVLFSDPESDHDYIIHCYSKLGRKVFSKKFDGGEVFGFSPIGNLYGIATNKHLQVLNLCNGEISAYTRGRQFDISHDETMVAVAYEGGCTVYAKGKSIGEIKTGMVYPRKIKISPDNKRVAILDKTTLFVYSIPECKPIYSDMLAGNNSFRDLILNNNTVWAGIHFKNQEVSRGILKTYDLAANSVREEILSHEPVEKPSFDRSFYEQESRKCGYPKIPWPFSPQNQAHPLWNNYVGLITASDGDLSGTYVHNGLDISCPAYTKAYAVMDGVVKFRGSILGGGDEYWRVATAEQQTSGWSEGWLYAHLVKTTIQVDVGDNVKTGDYLGQIYPYEVNYAHVHLARIRDHGTAWSFDDDEWGLCYNPELSLLPTDDTVPPKIVTAIPGKSKFAYCKNETSTYLNPDNISGDIDIIIKLYDLIGSSEYYQPAFSLYYWIKRKDNNMLIVDTTLAHIRNHAFPFFLPGNFNALARVLYKADATFPPGGWTTKVKYYPHILTNDNGDTVLSTGEKDSCLHTAKYGDGWHTVYVKASDCAGNTVIDSEDVNFNNGVTSAHTVDKGCFLISHVFTMGIGSPVYIRFHLPTTERISIKLYNLLGNEIKNLADETYQANTNHTISWDGTNGHGKKVTGGIYLFRLSSRSYNATGRIVTR